MQSSSKMQNQTDQRVRSENVQRYPYSKSQGSYMSQPVFNNRPPSVSTDLQQQSYPPGTAQALHNLYLQSSLKHSMHSSRSPPMVNNPNIYYSATPAQKNTISSTGVQKHRSNSKSSQTGQSVRKSTSEAPSSSHHLYKTKICRRFFSSGHCPFGSNCAFGHHSSELRPRPLHPLFRTRPCFSFLSSGFCNNGSSCRYIHTRDPNAFFDLPPHLQTVFISQYPHLVPASSQIYGSSSTIAKNSPHSIPEHVKSQHSLPPSPVSETPAFYYARNPQDQPSVYSPPSGYPQNAPPQSPSSQQYKANDQKREFFSKMEKEESSFARVSPDPLSHSQHSSTFFTGSFSPDSFKTNYPHHSHYSHHSPTRQFSQLSLNDENTTQRYNSKPSQYPGKEYPLSPPPPQTGTQDLLPPPTSMDLPRSQSYKM